MQGLRRPSRRGAYSGAARTGTAAMFQAVHVHILVVALSWPLRARQESRGAAQVLCPWGSGRWTSWAQGSRGGIDSRFGGACGGLVPPRKCCWCGEPTDERPPESIGCCEHCGRPACGYECRLRYEERCGAGREAAYHRTVEAASGLMSPSTGDPRGEARFTGHARRRTGAEAFTVAGVGVRVSQTFGRWGKTMIIWHGQEAPLCSSPQIAAKLRQPAHSSLAPKNTEVL